MGALPSPSLPPLPSPAPAPLALALTESVSALSVEGADEEDDESAHQMGFMFGALAVGVPLLIAVLLLAGFAMYRIKRVERRVKSQASPGAAVMASQIEQIVEAVELAPLGRQQETPVVLGSIAIDEADGTGGSGRHFSRAEAVSPTRCRISPCADSKTSEAGVMPAASRLPSARESASFTSRQQPQRLTLNQTLANPMWASTMDT